MGTLFLLTGLEKIADVKGFSVFVKDYQMLPSWAVLPLSATLSWVEVILGFLMLCGTWTGAAGLISSAMLIVFIGAAALAKLRGLDIDCGCFDLPIFGPSKIGWHTFVRDLAFLAMTLSLAFDLKKSD